MTISPETMPQLPTEQAKTETDEQKIGSFIRKANLPAPEIVPHIDRLPEVHIHLGNNKKDNEIIILGGKLQAQFAEHDLKYPIVFHLIGGRQIYVPTEVRHFEQNNN